MTALPGRETKEYVLAESSGESSAEVTAVSATEGMEPLEPREEDRTREWAEPRDAEWWWW